MLLLSYISTHREKTTVHLASICPGSGVILSSARVVTMARLLLFYTWAGAKKIKKKIVKLNDITEKNVKRHGDLGTNPGVFIQFLRIIYQLLPDTTYHIMFDDVLE